MSAVNNRRGRKVKVQDLKTTERNGAALIRDYQRLPTSASGSALSHYQILLLCRKPPRLRHAQASKIFDSKGRTFYKLGHDSYFTKYTDAEIASVNLTRDQLPRPASGGRPKKSRDEIKEREESEEVKEDVDENLTEEGDDCVESSSDGEETEEDEKGAKGKDTENATTEPIQLTWLMSSNGPNAIKYFAEVPPPANNGITNTSVSHMSELHLVLLGLDYDSLAKQVKYAVQQLRYMPKEMLTHFFPSWICLRYLENAEIMKDLVVNDGGDDGWMVKGLASQLDMTAEVMNALTNPRASRCRLEVGFDFASFRH